MAGNLLQCLSGLEGLHALAELMLAFAWRRKMQADAERRATLGHSVCFPEKSREPRMTKNAAALAEEHSKERYHEHFWFRAGAPQTPALHCAACFWRFVTHAKNRKYMETWRLYFWSTALPSMGGVGACMRECMCPCVCARRGLGG